MPRPLARFVRIARIRYPGFAAPRTRGMAPPPTDVQFEDGASGRLPHPAMDAGLLEALQQAGWPAYVALDGDVIQRVLPPSVGRVTCCVERPGHVLHVGLDSSPLALTLGVRTSEDERVAAVLRDAANTAAVVITAADDSGAIVDAAVAGPDDRRLAPSFGVDGAQPLEAIPVSPVPAAELPALAQRIDRLGCGSLAPPPCLPFRYLATGCEARAHRMCEVLGEGGITAGKVWVFDFPTAEDADAPGGGMYRWHWYVAPFVRVDGPPSAASVRVVDPALMTGAVTLEAFRKRLGVPPSALAFSRAACYRMGRDGRGAEPRPGEVRSDLDILRAIARVKMAT